MEYENRGTLVRSIIQITKNNIQRQHYKRENAAQRSKCRNEQHHSANPDQTEFENEKLKRKKDYKRL